MQPRGERRRGKAGEQRRSGREKKVGGAGARDIARRRFNPPSPLPFPSWCSARAERMEWWKGWLHRSGAFPLRSTTMVRWGCDGADSEFLQGCWIVGGDADADSASTGCQGDQQLGFPHD